MSAYAAAAEPADCACWRQVARRPAPKVNRACSSVASGVAAAVTTALASAQGSQDARPATAKPAASPTPPPQSTKRAKAVTAPEAACPRLPVLSMPDPFADSFAGAFAGSLRERHASDLGGQCGVPQWCHHGTQVVPWVSIYGATLGAQRR